MDATTTQSTTLLANIAADHPAITFSEGPVFAYSPTEKSITYNTSEAAWPYYLLHELGHALCGHDKYHRDIELLEIEREAWEKSIELTKRYGLDRPTDELVDAALDTYRDWLHRRSICPKCEQNGAQHTENSYLCLVCEQSWQVSHEKTCRSYRKKI